MLTPKQQAQLCPTCVADPHAAPGRYCARFSCLCGHECCPAFMSYVPRRPAEPLPDNVIHLTSRRTGLALTEEDSQNENGPDATVFEHTNG